MNAYDYFLTLTRLWIIIHSLFYESLDRLEDLIKRPIDNTFSLKKLSTDFSFAIHPIMDPDQYIQLSGPLFEAVQKAGLFSDSKTFVDATPKIPPAMILRSYEKEKDNPSFHLKNFIIRSFEVPSNLPLSSPSLKVNTMEEYIEATWKVLLKDMKASSPYSTLISLPHPHIVPGGRFRECFYWDSYFTALGLSSPKHLPLIKMMVENFAYLIDLLGFIPNGNRIYFTTRSQPPYFSFLLSTLFELGEEAFALQYFDQLEKEYHYWMNHSLRLGENLYLNHYFDTANLPRPEAYKREIELSKTSKNPQLFQHLRAACASGWDFSSRWIADPKRWETIEALNILPIDLNCLLFHLEETLARFSKQLDKNPKEYLFSAQRRKQAIQTLFWKDDFFFDY